MATELDLEVNQYETYTLTLSYTGDLTGYTARMQLRTSAAAASATVSITTSDDITITAGATTSSVVAVLSDTNTALLTSRRYVYDLLLDKSDSTVEKFYYGAVHVTPGVTRA